MRTEGTRYRASLQLTMQKCTTCQCQSYDGPYPVCWTRTRCGVACVGLRRRSVCSARGCGHARVAVRLVYCAYCVQHAHNHPAVLRACVLSQVQQFMKDIQVRKGTTVHVAKTARTWGACISRVVSAVSVPVGWPEPHAY